VEVPAVTWAFLFTLVCSLWSGFCDE